MGDYNPNSPIVVGNEFVGIREEDILLTTANDTEEWGYSFTTSGSNTLQDARVYFENSEWTLNNGTNITVNVYPAGLEDQTGPIRSVVIPVSSLNATGASPVGNGSLNTGTVVRNPLTTASSGEVAAALMGGGQSQAQVILPVPSVTDSFGARLLLSFDVAKYAQQLIGKRILGVNVLIHMDGGEGLANQDALASNSPVQLFLALSALGQIVNQNFQIFSTDSLQRVPLDNVNYSWNGAIATIGEARPWSLQELMNLDPAGNGTAANRITMWIERRGNAYFAATRSYQLRYVALEVVYCEEQRVAWGCLFQNSQASTIPMQWGTQIVPMRAPLTAALNPVLPAGSYTVTVSASYVATDLTVSSDFGIPPLNALRTLYTLPNLPGVHVKKPWPPAENIDETFSKEVTSVIPQLTIHTSSGPILQTQVYGQQALVPVYGAITASQGVSFPSSLTVSQVRYYARRFGNTTKNLVLTVSSSTATLTPSAYDALPEIIDGWKEITLPLNTPVTFGSGTLNAQWSAASENIGSRWEVLGLSAPAVSGTPSQHEQQSVVPAAQQLQAGTYLEPSGASILLNWQSPLVSGAAANDAQSDAVLLLSTTPPSITGLAAAPAILALTPLPYICGPLCTESIAPTGTGYNRITWTSPGVTGSAFGYLELQRLDAIDGVWSTIMKCTSPGVTGFSDYEARIGVQSQYRIRLANAQGFLGAFSSTATSTVPAPGVTAVQAETVAGSVLTFTSNQPLTGVSMAAFVQEFETNIEQSLTFNEAALNQLSMMFSKNFMSAFRPTERGGEQFAATLAVANGAVSGPILQKAFQNFRDLAWAQLPYVCVRNEIGDRWYANVEIPGGNIQGAGRIIQLASATITEVSDVPFPANPTTS